MESQFKTGILRTWNAERGFGFLEVPSTAFPLQRYFLHISMIKEGQNPPPIGSIVRFEPGRPKKEGQCLTAERAFIIVLPEEAPEKVSEPAPKEAV